MLALKCRVNVIIVTAMFEIIRVENFSPSTFLWEVIAPEIAQAARPGQFVIVRSDERSERIPLTIADFNTDEGTITLVIQAAGKSTDQMRAYRVGDSILDIVGPLGEPSEIENFGTVIVVGGGLGVAPVYPILRALKLHGCNTISIIGFRTKSLVFWEGRFRDYSDETIIVTDDGSYGQMGLVTQPLKEILAARHVDRVIAVGPLVMMRAAAETTRPFGVRTIVSINAIMVDGTGMCGSCRVNLAGEIKFACIDGPDMDGHLVNFDELIIRQRRFVKYEKQSIEMCKNRCQE
ncbi:MAG: sulfide/dihydroorotate dehydrogenase-like FAD/NAD-binding protein [Candidatus Magnetominusculus sp. LBB02]|nr:sulfide/dihydroorotate dehydrogenase-like FAD/NAD-binding protein [Candidatus Magnetominusculus sp. LBB02]